MMIEKRTTEEGYIALIAAILISVSLLIMVAVVSFEGFYSRFTILESELKEQSDYLAEACVQTAILKISKDEQYYLASFPEIILVEANDPTDPGDDMTCEIVDVSHIGFGIPGDYNIEAKGVSGDAITNLCVTVEFSSNTSYTIEDWEEIGNFPC